MDQSVQVSGLKSKMGLVGQWIPMAGRVKKAPWVTGYNRTPWLGKSNRSKGKAGLMCQGIPKAVLSY